MEVNVKSPHTLHVEVYEKGLLGYLYMDSLGQNVYFDKDGFVVEMSTDVIEGVPQITGLTCGDAVLYEKLDVRKCNPAVRNDYGESWTGNQPYGKSSSYGENYAKSGRTYRYSSSGRLDRRYHRYYF